MCMYIYVYLYISVNIYIYIYLHLNQYVYLYVSVYIYIYDICIHIFISIIWYFAKLLISTDPAVGPAVVFFFSEVDSSAPSIAWTGDLKRFVNLDPEDASDIRTCGSYGLGIQLGMWDMLGWNRNGCWNGWKLMETNGH